MTDQDTDLFLWSEDAVGPLPDDHGPQAVTHARLVLVQRILLLVLALRVRLALP